MGDGGSIRWAPVMSQLFCVAYLAECVLIIRELNCFEWFRGEKKIRG